MATRVACVILIGYSSLLTALWLGWKREQAVERVLESEFGPHPHLVWKCQFPRLRWLVPEGWLQRVQYAYLVGDVYTDRSVAAISGLDYISRVTIVSDKVSMNAVASMLRATSVSELQLTGVSAVDLELVLSSVKDRVILRKCSWSDRGLNSGVVRTARDVRVYEAVEVGAVTMALLASKTLEVLSISNSELTGTDFDRLSRLPQLRVLRLQDVVFTDRAAAMQTTFSSLQRVLLDDLVSADWCEWLSRQPQLQQVLIGSGNADGALTAQLKNARPDVALGWQQWEDTDMK